MMKGKKEVKIEVAVKMLEKGLEVTLIAEMTGLTENEINKMMYKLFSKQSLCCFAAVLLSEI